MPTTSPRSHLPQPTGHCASLPAEVAGSSSIPSVGPAHPAEALSIADCRLPIADCLPTGLPEDVSPSVADPQPDAVSPTGHQPTNPSRAAVAVASHKRVPDGFNPPGSPLDGPAEQQTGTEAYLPPESLCGSNRAACPSSPSPQTPDPIPQTPPPRPPKFTAADLLIGNHRLNLLRPTRELLAAGHSWKEIGAALGTNWQKLRKWHLSVVSIPTELLTAEDLARRTSLCGRPAEMRFTEAEVKHLRADKLITNRTFDQGSSTVAIERAIQAGVLRPELVEFLRARARAGKPLLTAALRKQLHISPAITRHFRHKRNAHLDLVQSPGSLAFTRDAVTGQHRHLLPGERWTLDDGTKNFVCCVAGLRREGDECWKNFGVVIGRWQILVPADHVTLFVPGYCHTARPKGSYRAEDELAALLPCFEEHGVPPQIILENGISRAGLINQALTGLGVQVLHASGPHEKVIESIFNNLWTRLSFVPGQVGRFQGEEGEVNAIIESCRNGATDPRKYFPMLPDVLTALEASIHDWNTHTVRSPMHGHWVPAEAFAARAHQTLKPFPQSHRWLFAPAVTDPLLVTRCDVDHRYLLMPGLSLPVNFSAPFLANYLGKRVRFHYNPHAPEMEAYCVLAEDCGEQRAGTPLGPVRQINLNARVTRKAFGIRDLDDEGQAAMRQNGQALARTAKAMRPDGKPSVSYTETRAYHADGAPVSDPAAPAVAVQPRRSIFAPPTADQASRRRARLAQQAESARALRDLQPV